VQITIFGSGYVGLVTGACLADAGNDQDKIEKCQDDFRRDLGG